MASSSSSIGPSLASLPPVVYPLGVGLLVTSSILFGNIGLSLTGPLPIIREQIGASTLSAKQKVRVWKLFFDEAAKFVVGGTGLTIAAHLSVPFLTAPGATHGPILRNLAITSAVASALVLPYTLIFIAPTINELQALDKQSSQTTVADDKRVTGLIAKWDRRHKVRYLLFSTAWVSGLAALLVAVATA